MIDPDQLDWVKDGGLVPAIVQDRIGMVTSCGGSDQKRQVGLSRRAVPSCSI